MYGYVLNLLRQYLWYIVVENPRLGYDLNRSVNKHRVTHVVHRSSALMSKSSCFFFHFSILSFWQRNYSAVNANVSLMPNLSYTVVMVSSDHVYCRLWRIAWSNTTKCSISFTRRWNGKKTVRHGVGPRPRNPWPGKMWSISNGSSGRNSSIGKSGSKGFVGPEGSCTPNVSVSDLT